MDDGHRGSVFGRRDLDLVGHGIPTLAVPSNDEIDLGRLCHGLIREWKTIMIVVFLGTVLSIVLALHLSKTFLIESTVRAPDFREMGDLKKQEILTLSPEDVLKSLADHILLPDNIRSALLKSAWWEKVSRGNDLSSEPMINGIRENLKLSRVKHDYYELGKDEKTPFRELEISLLSADPQETVAFMQALIATAHEDALDEISKRIQSIRQIRIEYEQNHLQSLAHAERQSREAKIARLRAENYESIARLQQQIDLKLRKAKQDRENRVIQFTEALQVAEALNIQEPVTWDDLRPLRKPTQITNEYGGTDTSEPLYFRGTRLLQAELDRLKGRQDDRPFTSDLSELENQLIQLQNDPRIAALESRTNDAIYAAEFDDLQRRLTRLQAQPTRFDNARLAVVSQPPSVPDSPRHSPVKIVLAGMFLSGFIALVIGFLRVSMKN